MAIYTLFFLLKFCCRFCIEKAIQIAIGLGGIFLIRFTSNSDVFLVLDYAEK